MEFEYSKKTKMYMEQLTAFMTKYIYPNEKVFHDQLSTAPTRWQIPPIMEELKATARERGLWNLVLPESGRGAGLTNLEYAPLCEIMGRSPIAPEAFNCSAPDTGNMEVLERYGTPEQKKQWLEPLLDGKIRSAFAMTEPKVASSDATNIESSIVRDGAHYVINGHKWWTSGIGDPRCAILIFMGKTDAKNPDKYKQQSMILVPRGAPGDRRDQGGRAQHDARGDRACPAAPRGRRREPGVPARVDVGALAHAPLRRRAGRGAPPADRAPRAPQAQLGNSEGGSAPLPKPPPRIGCAGKAGARNAASPMRAGWAGPRRQTLARRPAQ